MRKDPTGSYIWGFHDETPSEKKLSAAMRKAGLKFGQEVAVKGFTVDFLLDEWLIVEVDGESHLISGRAEKDASRQKVLEGAGFTVLRVPARELSSDSDLRRWIKKIKEQVDAGPPYLTRQRFSNEDYRRQLEQVKKALKAGEEERRKREALAFGEPEDESQGSGPAGEHGRGAPRGSRASGPEESMEDYFGKAGQNFESMLKNYDWGKAPEKDERAEPPFSRGQSPEKRSDSRPGDGRPGGGNRGRR